jgi:pyrophosphatase PpaX
MKSQQKTIYLFDLDGTLIDSVELIMDSFTHAMMKHLGEVKNPDRFRKSIGQPLRTQFAMFTEDHPLIETLIESYSAYYREHRSQATLFDGARDLLESLTARGTPMAIVTSKSHVGAVRSTKALDIDGYFSILIGSDDVIHGKPHPEPVLKALDHFQASPDDAIFIGDSPHDMEAGKRADVRAIGVTWGPYSETSLRDAGAERVVCEIGALLDL